MRIIPSALVVGALASSALAQETLEVGSTLPPEPPRETPGADLAPAAPVRGWVTPDPLAPILRPYRSAQEALADRGFEFTLGVTLVYQHASDALPGAERDWFTGSYDIEGYGSLFDDDRYGAGSLGLLIEGGEVFDHSDEFDLSANLGSIHAVNSDATGHDIAVAELWYEHRFGEAVTVTLGKIDPTAYFDQNAAANDETTLFLASPLVNNAAIAFPDRGLGANVWWTIDDTVYATAGVSDAQGDTRESGFDTIDEGDAFAAIELGVAPAFPFGEGTYRVTAWHAGYDGAEGAGVAINVDQRLGAESPVIVFARFGVGDDEVAPAKQAASAGIGIEDPLGRADDFLAFGWAWSEPSDPSLDPEHLFEVFYRLQLTETIGLTPDLQFLPDPADPDEDDAVFIAALRLQATF